MIHESQELRRQLKLDRDAILKKCEEVRAVMEREYYGSRRREIVEPGANHEAVFTPTWVDVALVLLAGVFVVVSWL